MLKLKLQYFWPSDANSWLIWKDPDAGKDWGQQENGVAEDAMVGWRNQLNGHEFVQTLGDSERLESLVWYSPCGCKELDMTEQLNNSILFRIFDFLIICPMCRDFVFLCYQGFSSASRSFIWVIVMENKLPYIVANDFFDIFSKTSLLTNNKSDNILFWLIIPNRAVPHKHLFTSSDNNERVLYFHDYSTNDWSIIEFKQMQIIREIFYLGSMRSVFLIL